MPRGLWLRGRFDEIRKIVEEYVGSLGKNARPRRAGRLYIYKVGLISKIVLAPYSDGTTYLSVPERHEALLDRLAPYVYREPPRRRDAVDQVLDLIIERQILLDRVRISRAALTRSFILIVLGLTVLAAGLKVLGTFLSAIGVLSFFIPVGMHRFWASRASVAIPVLYPRYRRRLEEVTVEIKALVAGLPAKDREKLVRLKAYPRD